MKHYGDITKINGATVETVDIICGGSPCQDLSIAGKRAGLAGERSGLFMDQIRIIKEMRRNDELHCGRTNDTVRCRFMVWENVAGAFSSNDGEDFRAVLEETVRVIDKNACVPSIGNRKWPHAGCIMGTVDGSAYSVAWRLHDAQFWGVPQRRKRIALVADFGGTAAPEILFECESMSRNTSKSERESKRASDNSKRSIGETSECIGADVKTGTVTGDKAPALTAACGLVNATGPKVVIGTDLYNAKMTGDKAATFTAAAGTSATHSGPTVLCVQGNAIDRQPQNGPCGKGVTEDVSFTLNTIDKHAVAYRICSVNSHSMQSDNPKSGIYKADVAPTVDVSGGNPACNQGGLAITDGETYQEKTGTLDCGISKGTSNQIAANNMLVTERKKNSAATVVRRLTPLECERLQGFPDDWTNIGDWIDSKGKLHKGESDSPRYKALGNSIALPFWQWLAERIAKHLPQGATMASLFDGIGGFPLVFSRCGVRPVWASEIEEFPIAVTKKHFPEE